MQYSHNEYIKVGVLSDLIDYIDSSNSCSISFEQMRVNYPEWKDFTDDELNELFSNVTESSLYWLDLYGVDETFLYDEDQVNYEEGEYSLNGGYCLTFSDTLLHKDFKSFCYCEKENCEEEQLKEIEVFYDKWDKILALSSEDELINSISSSNDSDVVFLSYLSLWQIRKKKNNQNLMAS